MILLEFYYSQFCCYQCQNEGITQQIPGTIRGMFSPYTLIYCTSTGNFSLIHKSMKPLMGAHGWHRTKSSVSGMLGRDLSNISQFQKLKVIEIYCTNNLIELSAIHNDNPIALGRLCKFPMTPGNSVPFAKHMSSYMVPDETNVESSRILDPTTSGGHYSHRL